MKTTNFTVSFRTFIKMKILLQQKTTLNIPSNSSEKKCGNKKMQNELLLLYTKQKKKHEKCETN